MAAPQEIDIDLGGPVHYADWGGSGPAILFIHGLSGSRLNWMAVAPKLAETHHVYAIDFIGHGRTPVAGRTASLENHRRLIDRFIKEVIKEPAIIIGNSTGGHICVREAAREPEQVRAVVLVDASVPLPVAGFSAFSPVLLMAFAPLLVRGVGETMLKLHYRRRSAESVVRHGLRLCTPHPERIAAEIVRAHVDEYTGHLGSKNSIRGFAMTARSLFWNNARRRRFYADARRVKAPTLILQGSEDPLVPMSSTRALHDVRPDWDMHVFEGVGHIPMMEVPAEFVTVVEGWLDKLQTRAA